MVKIVSWNIGGREAAWEVLLDMDVDIALLQEARPPPPHLAEFVEVDPSPWYTAGGDKPWKAAGVKLSDRVEVEWIEAKSIPMPGGTSLPSAGRTRWLLPL